MTYSEIKKIVHGKVLPLTAENSDGEFVIIEGNESCYILTTLQDNDWCRINEYYPDGTVTETYEK
jgi:hypothetical protein